MKKVNILIFMLILIGISCQKSSEVVNKDNLLGEKLKFSMSNAEEIDSPEVGVKGKWYIAKKKYVNGVKKCPGGFGLCKGYIYGYTKHKKKSSITNNEETDLGNDESSIVTGLEAYRNFLKIEFDRIPDDYQEEIFYFKETIDNETGLFLNNESFKSFEILDGTYRINRPTNQKPYLLLKYKIIK